VVDHESTFYRQFGDIDSAAHPLKDKEGNNIPSTARSYGNIISPFLCVLASLAPYGALTLLTHNYIGGNRKNSFIGQATNGSFSGRSRQSFILRKSFGAGSVGGPPGTPPWIQDPQTHRSAKDFPLLKKGTSFNIGNSSSRQKLVTRTSISTIGGSSLGGADNVSVNGDITVRSGGLSHRGLTTTRSQSQIVSQVRVKSFQGGGPAPRLVKMVQTTSNIAGVARSRYLTEHEDDVQAMQNFFRRAGLSMQKSIACAEEAICLDASSPRKLFKYVHEVSGFSLMNLGMDRIDAELVLEVLNNEFSHRDISAESAAASAVAKMMGGAGGGGATNFKHSIATDTSQSWSNAPMSTTTMSMIERMRPDEALKVRRIAEHEDDIVDMQEFFRFSGLSVTLSRQCAEHAISMDANSPRKLYKYLEEVKGFYLTDLGMDGLEADMVMKALKREFGGQSDKIAKPSTRKKQPRSREEYEYDYKSDSSEDFEEKTESVSSSMHNMSRVRETQEKVSVIPPPRQPLNSSSSKNSLVPMLKATSSHVAPPRSSFSGLDSELLFKAKVRAALEHQNKGSPVSPASQGSYDSSAHSLEISLALGNLPPKPAYRGDEEQKDPNDFLTERTPATESTFTGTFYSCDVNILWSHLLHIV
jgi:hypothetical protein